MRVVQHNLGEEAHQTEQVCQPLAIKPPKTEALAASEFDMEGLGS